MLDGRWASVQPGGEVQQHTAGARQPTQPPASKRAGGRGRSCPPVNTAHPGTGGPPPTPPAARLLVGRPALGTLHPRAHTLKKHLHTCTHRPASHSTGPTHHAYTHPRTPSAPPPFPYRYLVERLTDSKQYALKLTDMSQLEEPLRWGRAGG